jgi:tetratricopeptide (TPR) repeat protein
MGAINSEKSKRTALLDEARVSLETGLGFALDHDYRWEQPDLYHQLASVYWYLGREIDSGEYQGKARSFNEIAINLSVELHNNRYVVDAIVGEMEFDSDAGIDENIEGHLVQLEPYRKYDFPLYFGRVYRILGDWAYRKGNFEKALIEYSRAMPLLNRHGGYGPYTIEIELSKLAKNIERLPLEQAISFLNSLKEAWSQLKTAGHVDLLFWVEEQLEQVELLKEGN